MKVFWEWTNCENILDYFGVRALHIGWQNEQKRCPEGPIQLGSIWLENLKAKRQKRRQYGGKIRIHGILSWYKRRNRPTFGQGWLPTLQKNIEYFDIMNVGIIGTFDCQSFSKSSTWVSLSPPLWSRSGKNCISAVMSKASKNLRQIKEIKRRRGRRCAHLSRSCCQAWSTFPAGRRTPRLRKAPLCESLWELWSWSYCCYISLTLIKQ